MRSYHKKKGRSSGQFAALPFQIIDSDAYRSLKPAAVSVYIQLLRRFNGSNNGYIPYSCRDVAEACNIGKMTAQRAFKQLEAVGLIECIVPSSFNSRKKMAREWAVTHHPVGDNTASRKWKHFKLKPSTKKKKMGTKSDTDILNIKNYVER